MNAVLLVVGARLDLHISPLLFPFSPRQVQLAGCLQSGSAIVILLLLLLLLHTALCVAAIALDTYSSLCCRPCRSSHAGKENNACKSSHACKGNKRCKSSHACKACPSQQPPLPLRERPAGIWWLAAPPSWPQWHSPPPLHTSLPTLRPRQAQSQPQHSWPLGSASQL